MALSLGRVRWTPGRVVIVICFEAASVFPAILLLSSMALPILGLAFFLRGAFWSFRQVMTAVIGEVLPDHAMAKGYGLGALASGAAAVLADPISDRAERHPADSRAAACSLLVAVGHTSS